MITKDKLPQKFKERIERFNRLFLEATGKTFEESDLYKYEMMCIEIALSFYEYHKDKELPEYIPDIHDYVWGIKDKLLYWDDDISYNGLGASWNLFRCYREDPEYIPYCHGCLAYLVGDKGYHDDRTDVPRPSLSLSQGTSSTRR